MVGFQTGVWFQSCVRIPDTSGVPDRDSGIPDAGGGIPDAGAGIPMQVGFQTWDDRVPDRG